MKKIKLSASKIKTFCNCSYFFLQNYINKVPQKEHMALPKGHIIHTILEVLLVKNRRELVKEILDNKTIVLSKSIYRLVNTLMKKAKILTQENFDEVDKCILVGLSNDFFCEGASKVTGEFEFNIPLKEYILNGYIDKLAIYDDSIIIRDYKSNKNKFDGEEKTANTQAFIYLWVARQLFPGKKKYILEFIFLRYPRNPIQRHEYTPEQIDGFIHWVLYIAKYIANFDDEAAVSNFAYDDKKKSWLCKAGKTWKCPYYDPFTYYELLDKDDTIIKRSVNNNFIIQDGYKIREKKYDGCARFTRAHPVSIVENNDDFFGD